MAVMGQLYLEVEHYLDRLAPTAGSVFVEIGSDKGQGSTLPLAAMALRLGQRLITVDIEENIAGKLHYRYPSDARLDNIDCVCAHGSTWAQEVFPMQGQSISCLYLDNFDWDYGDAQWGHLIQEQQEDYARRGYKMTNFNSQLEHLAQMIALLPYMDDTSIVVCDDTYTWNCSWVGKSGAVVPYLELNGYSMLKKDSSAVMLARNLKG